MKKLSVIIPARNEAENLPICIAEIFKALDSENIDHEILVIDDGSNDDTIEQLDLLSSRFPTIRYIENKKEHGFGRAVGLGLKHFAGDAVAIMMADRSDSPQDLITYWKAINNGSDCVFGSRFIEGGKHLITHFSN